MGFHESFVVPKISGTDGVNDMTDRLKRRHKDYKRIITMKTLDTSFYREGLPYLVKFHGDEKGKGIDNCDGRVGICIGASGGNLTFVFVSGTFVHEEYTHKVVSISCSYLDQSKIEIIPYWSDTAVLRLVDSVKRNPDDFHGYNYWNEEIEIFDQDNFEEASLLENFAIINNNTYPLLIPDEAAEKHDEDVSKWKEGVQFYTGKTVEENLSKDKHYKFNMSALEALEKCSSTVKFSIKRKHLDEWKTYGGFKIKVLHDPDGFQMYHTPETDGENMIKDTWFAGDILSHIKGMKLEVEKTEGDNDNLLIVETDNTGTDIVSATKVTLDLSKDVRISITETEPDTMKFYIDDQNKIIDQNVPIRYPLFVRDEHSNDRWIINYDVLCKALYRKDVIFDISFKIKDCRAQACCSCKADDVEVHVGGTVLTGRRFLRKSMPATDAIIEFKADDWKMMDFAHVKLRRINNGI